MKKLLSILLTVALLMSSVGLVAFAAGDETASGDPTPVFELDMSEYTAENPVLKDKANKAWKVDIHTNTSNPNTGFRPVKSSEKNIFGESFDYLYFIDRTDNQNTVWNSRGAAAIAYVGDEVLGQNELTFEFWARYKTDANVTWSRLFQLMREDTKETDIEIGSANTQFRFCGKNCTITVENSKLWNGEWRHIVVNRKFVKEESNSGSSVIGTIYVDGAQLTQQTFSLTDGYMPDGTENKANTDGVNNGKEYQLSVGGSNSGAGSYAGDLASFKVYNTSLTAEQIKTDYENEVDGFGTWAVNADFSNYDGTDESITDKGAFGSEFYQTARVRKGTYVNEKGREVTYVDAYSETSDSETEYGRFGFIDNDFTKLKDQTISFWVNVPRNADHAWGQILTQTQQGENDAARFELELTSGVDAGADWAKFRIRAQGSQSEADDKWVQFDPYTWMNFTVTKSWSKNESNQDVVTWNTYIDGVKNETASGSSALIDGKDATMDNFEVFCFGSKFRTTETQGGGLTDAAAFKIYTRALTADQVAALYAAEKADYKEATVTVEKTFTLADNTATAEVSLNNKGTGTLGDYQGILAVYEGEKLVKAAMADFAISDADSTAAPSVTLSVDSLDSTKTYSYKLFVWDKDLKPLVAAMELSAGAE